MPLAYSWKSAAGKDILGLLANNPFNFIMLLSFLQLDLCPYISRLATAVMQKN